MKHVERSLGARVLSVLGAISAIHATACTTKRVEPEAVSSLPRNASVDVVLVDGTELVLERPRVVDGAFCGEAGWCEGPGCPPRGATCIARERVAKVTRTTPNTTAIGVAGALVVGAAIITMVAATSSKSTPKTEPSSSGGYGAGSCPHVYAWTGTEWALDSGTFGVSWFSSAQRTDFDRLDRLEESGGTYRLRLANELEETEHTDLVRLHVVDHPADARIVPSASGRIHALRAEASPLRARDLRGRDATDLVARRDGRAWTSTLHGRRADREEDARDGLRLLFSKPRDAKVATLAVSAHVTDWSAEMLGFFLSRHGTALPAWFARFDDDAAARAALDAFLAREGMLNVRVRTPSGFAQRGLFWAAGPEIVKEEAFELSIADVPGDVLEVELESATDFWRIDAVSVAYGPSAPIEGRALSPSRAIADGRDVTRALAKADGVRLDTRRGDVAELVFEAPPPPPSATRRSFVLETTGYYRPDVPPAPGADGDAIDQLIGSPFAASRLALMLRLQKAR